MAVSAFLVHQNQLFYTQSLEHPTGTLLEGIWSNFSDQARAITRNRIYSNVPLSVLDEGMLKVVGKRASVVKTEELDLLIKPYLDFKSHEVKQSSGSETLSPIEFEMRAYTHNEAMVLALELSKKSKLEIAALLLDETGKIVSWGWNDHFPNKTLHAEVMVVKNYISKFNKKIPKNFTLISTLQPCAMCAGYLHGNSQDFKTLKIIWLKDDPGPMAQNSILVPHSDLWKKLCL